MRCLFLRGLTFSAPLLFTFIGAAAIADDGFPGGPPPSDEIRVVGSASAGATDQDAIRSPEAASSERSSDGASIPDRRQPATQQRANGAASKAKPSDERPKSEPTGERPLPAVDSEESPPVEIEATSFKGVAPGTSTPEDVAKAWGQPKKTKQAGGSLVQLYTVEPFKRVEVNYAKGKVSAVVIRLDRSFPVEAVAKHLELAAIRPVVVRSESGEILGRAYPERGVLLASDPKDQSDESSMKIAQIVLEPISAEPFLLRAEATMTTRCDSSCRDLQQALTLEPGNARAHWLYSRAMAATEQQEKSVKAASEAVRLDPNNPQYRLTYAQALAQDGQLPEATEQARKALAGSEDQPHVKARAMCLIGDLLASESNADFAKALDFHTQAIQLADPLTSDSHPAIRVAAKEVLVDAHLGAAHDIAWGEWKDKPKAVARWLDRATAVANDLVSHEAASEEQLFHVYVRSLAAYVGVRGEIDPASAAKSVLTTGEHVIAAAHDPLHKARLQGELGTALYDAVQICQMRSESEAALMHGETAAKHLADSMEARATPSSTLLLGRLYFRMGTIHAMHNHDHKGAIGWFDKAIPLMERASSEELAGDLGRHGEAFVSMGVSYWEAGRRDKAVALTQQGIEWMEQAVKNGAMDRSSLALPYSNLAAMHRKLGHNDVADRFQEMASRVKGKKLK